MGDVTQRVGLRTARVFVHLHKCVGEERLERLHVLHELLVRGLARVAFVPSTYAATGTIDNDSASTVVDNYAAAAGPSHANHDATQPRSHTSG